MKDRLIPAAAVVLAVAALVLAAMGRVSKGTTYWVTARTLVAGSRLTGKDVEQIRVSGAPVASALPASDPLPSQSLKRSLPAGTFLAPSDFGAVPTIRQASRVDVPIPVGTSFPALTKGSAAVIAAWGTGQPPQVISPAASVVGVSGQGGEVTAVVALPLVEAEQVLAALSAGKVAVLPWQP